MNEIPPRLDAMCIEESAETGQGEEAAQAEPDQDNVRLYEQVLKSIEDMAVHLRPLVESGSDEENIPNSAEDHAPSDARDTFCDTNNPLKSSDASSLNHQVANNTSSDNAANKKNTNSLASLRGSEQVKSSSQNMSNRNSKHNLGGYKNGTISNSPSHHSGQQQQQQQKCVLSRPMQRKLFSLLQCQLLEEEGQARSARIARSLGERVVTELLVLQQYPHQLSSNLWAAVRTRGCQFLGPAMQEEVLKLILLALEDGSPLSRKVLVLFVVQKLEVRYSQASKTAIGHVVQLLYRASCFKVQKRDGESSLMQLKEEFRQYEALRREHDSQIVQIALEAGLRISPEQWSSLLYGDVAHKPHMQSIIDKHQSPQSFAQNIAELMEMLQKNPDGSNLLRLRPHLEFLTNIDPGPDSPTLSWENLGAVMRSVNTIVNAFVEYQTLNGGEHSPGGGTSGPNAPPDTSLAQNTRYKTSMCRDYSSRGACPRGPTCTFAHTQEEMEKYRLRSRKNGVRGRLPTQERTTSSLTQSESDQLRQVQLISKLKDEMPSQANSMISQITTARADGASDVAKILSSLPASSFFMKNNPAQMNMLPGSENFPSGIGSIKFGPGDVEKRQNINMPTTRLTFSRPTLDGQEPANASAMNQQASLHPNNPHAQPFVPTKNLPIPSSVLPPPPSHLPMPAGSLVGLNPGQRQDSGSGIVSSSGQAQLQQQPQEFQPGTGLAPIPAPSANHHPYLPATEQRLPSYCGEYSPYHSVRLPQDCQINGVVMDQQQLQAGMMSTTQVMPYPGQSFCPPQPGDATLSPQPGFPASLLVPIPVVVQQARDSASLGDLWQRKQDIIQHLRDDPTFLDWQDPTLYQADSQRAGFHGLDTVLSHNKHTRETMPKPVSDMFVATRSTQSLDKLVYEEPAFRQCYNRGEHPEPGPVNNFALHHTPAMNQFGNEQFPSSSSSHINVYDKPGAEVWPKVPLSWQNVGHGGGSPNYNHSSRNMNNSSSSGGEDYHSTCNELSSSASHSKHSLPMSSAMFSSYSLSSSQDYQGQQMSMYNSLSNGSGLVSVNSTAADSEFSHFPDDDGDETFIPFEQTKVSKFGPISRLNKAKIEYNAPVQVTADLTRPTLNTGPSAGYGLMEHLGPASSQPGGCMGTTSFPAQHKPVERLVGEPAVKPTALESRSIWEQSPLPSYKNIAQLMVGAAGAVSNNEKLAYQLQAVELEISLKTGRKPEPVGKMIQAAVGGSPLGTTPGMDLKGLMDVFGTGHVNACLRNMELGSKVKADERFADWNGVSK